jgi:LmbE family N-acetylglucosaminyl deacetylase
MRQVHPVPDEMIALSVDVSSVWGIKLAAMGCHASQWSCSPMANAPEERRRLFFGREYFVRAASRDTHADFLPAVLKEHLV